MLAESHQLHVTATTLSDHVADAILDAIVAGELACGQRLTAAGVADWLGVSRAPAREAFLILHRKRILDRDTSRSFVVARWNRQDLLEIAQVRAALEALVVELAIAEVSPEDIDHLESIVMQMEGALSRGDHERLVQLDSQFHSSLWRIQDNTRLSQMLEDLNAQVRYFMRITRPGDELDYPSTHRELISALQSGDINRAKAEIREHILSTAMRAIARLDSTVPTV